MLRVSESNPCPVCSKPDWCMYAEDGTAAICTRISEGSVKKCGEAGYLHIIKEGFKPKPVVKKRPVAINWSILNKCYKNTFAFGGNHTIVLDLIDNFKISCSSLNSIEPGWDGEAYTFPVRNADDEIIGISRRFPDGRKSTVKGSQVGIFIPRVDWGNLDTLFICEGASDTATALDMGLWSIGRASCQSGKDHIIKFCAKKRPSQIVIVADNDKPGIAGAKALGLWISQGYHLFTIPMPDLKIITPPTGIKDLRQWRERGLILERLMDRVEETLDFDG